MSRRLMSCSACSLVLTFVTTALRSCSHSTNRQMSALMLFYHVLSTDFLFKIKVAVV